MDDTEDKRLVQRLVDWFTRRGYTAYSLIFVEKLDPDYWYGWPEDIFWQHRDADPFLCLRIFHDSGNRCWSLINVDTGPH